MGDAFRGLTIRIGADTRPLAQAINGITKSAGAAQAQMNRLSKAMKFDKNNAALMASKIDLLGDKATHSARAFQRISTAMDQAKASARELASKAGTSADRFEKLVGSTREAYAATEKLRAEYNGVDKQLNAMRDDMARIRASEKDINFTKAKRQVTELRKAMSGVGPEAEKARAEIERMLTLIATKNAGAGAPLEKVQQEAKQLIGTFDRLRTQHVSLQRQMTAMNNVEAFHAMKYQAQAFEAELRQAVAETARLKSELYALGTNGALASNLDEVRMLSAASDKATADAKQMAEAYKAFPQSVGAAEAKIRSAKAAQATLTEQIKQTKAALAKVEADPAFDKLAANSDQAYIKAVKVEQEYTKIGTELKKEEELVKELGMSMRSMWGKMGKDAKNDAGFKEMAASAKTAVERIHELRAQLGALEGDHRTAALTTQFHDLNTTLASAQTRMAALAAQSSKLAGMNRFGKSLRELGFGMYASLTPAIMMAGRYAITAAKDIDSAYRDMRKTVNGTDEEFEALKADAIEFSKTHVTSAEQMLEIESIGGQLGVQVQDLRDFAHTVSNLDIATNMDTEDIATDLGKMSSVMGFNVEQYDRFGDALVRLGNNMPTMESDIMNLTTRYMGMGKVVGMAPDQMLAWSAAASSTGQKAEAAGSAMQRFISNMETAVMSGGEDLDKWAKVAGMSADDFKTKFEKDASGAMFDFVAGLGAMQNAGESVNQQLRDLGINNVRDKQLLEGLAQQMANVGAEGSVLAQALQMANDAWNGQSTVLSNGKVEEAGDAMREAEKKSEGFSGALEKMVNQAKALADAAADGAMPIIQDLGSMFQDLTNMVTSLPDGMKTGLVGIAGALAAIGPLGVGVGTAFTTISNVAQGLGKVPGIFTNIAAHIQPLNANSAKAAAGMSKLKGVLGALGTTKGMLGLTAAAGAITVIVGAIQDYMAEQEKLEKATSGVLEAVNTSSRLMYSQHSELDGYSDALKTTAMSADELVESTAQMTDEMNQRSAASAKDIGQLKAAQQAIDKYMNTDMSGDPAAQAMFASAVQTVNSLCGTQYEVIDQVNGKLADEAGQLQATAGAIDEYIQSKQKQIQMDQLATDLAAINTQVDEAVAAYSAANKARDSFWKQNQDEYNSTFTSESRKDDILTQAQTYDAEVTKTKAVLDDLIEGRGRLESQIEATAAAADQSTRSIDNMAKSNSTLSKLLSGAEMTDFAAALQGAGMTMGEFYDVLPEKWGEAVDAWRKGGNDIEAALAALGLSSRTMAEQYAAEVMAATNSTKNWDNALKTTKLSGDELAGKLQEAGISAQQFAGVSSSAFDALYQSAGGDFSKIAQSLDFISAAGIDLKNIKFDNGQLMTSKGLILSIKDDMATITDGNGNVEREFKITASGFEEIPQEVAEAEAEVDNADATMDVDADTSGLDEGQAEVEQTKSEAEEGATMTVSTEIDDEKVKSLLSDMLANDNTEINATFNVTENGIEDVASAWDGLKADTSIDASYNLTVTGVDEAAGAMESLRAAVDGALSNTVSIDYQSAVGAIEQTNTLADAINGLPDGDVYIYGHDRATSVVNSVREALDGINNKTVHTYIVTHRSSTGSGGSDGPGSATGGISKNLLARIPMNAAGGISGIATRAMLTQNGWVGEDGAEALIRMNHSQAIVPLSNRRYVRPFARAVASEMGGAGPQQVVHKHYTVNGMSLRQGSDGAKALEALFDAIAVGKGD